MAHLSNIEGIEMEGKLPEVRLAATPFEVVSPYEPAGDQPQAIEKLAKGIGRIFLSIISPHLQNRCQPPYL